MEATKNHSLHLIIFDYIFNSEHHSLWEANSPESKSWSQDQRKYDEASHKGYSFDPLSEWLTLVLHCNYETQILLKYKLAWK